MGPFDESARKRSRPDSADGGDTEDGDQEISEIDNVYVPTRPGFDQVVLHATDPVVLSRRVLRIIAFPGDVMVGAFLYVMDDTATVPRVHQGITERMKHWGCGDGDIPSMSCVARILYSLVMKNESVMVFNNPTPPHDAIYALKPETRMAYSNLILTPAPMNTTDGVDAATKVVMTLAVIRSIMFPYMDQEEGRSENSIWFGGTD